VEDRVYTAHRRHCPHDIGIAEELAQDALVTALELWPPEEGIPENPGAWLMTATKRRAIDSLRAIRYSRWKRGPRGIGDGLRLRDLAGAGPAQP
jgi:predicted RNA polymerase sigma factor